MAKPKLVLYLDVVSPFAYLAFHVVSTSPVFKVCDVTYVPVFLGGIMRATNNTPPIQIKNKGEYSARERIRWATKFNVPLAQDMPPDFPHVTIFVQRALTVVSLERPQQLADAFGVLYDTSFVKRELVHTPEALFPIFSKLFGESATKEILGKATSDEVKKLLIAKTDEALAEGSFGLPWFVATNPQGEKECYWGFDHIAEVTDHLGIERPQPGDPQKGRPRALL